MKATIGDIETIMPRDIDDAVEREQAKTDALFLLVSKTTDETVEAALSDKRLVRGLVLVALDEMRKSKELEAGLRHCSATKSGPADDCACASKHQKIECERCAEFREDIIAAAIRLLDGMIAVKK